MLKVYELTIIIWRFHLELEASIHIFVRLYRESIPLISVHIVVFYKIAISTPIAFWRIAAMI